MRCADEPRGLRWQTPARVTHRLVLIAPRTLRCRTEFIPFVRRRLHTERNEFRSTTWLPTHGRQPRWELPSTARVAQVTSSASGAIVSRGILSLHRVGRPLAVGCRRHRKRHHRRPCCLSRRLCHQGTWWSVLSPCVWFRWPASGCTVCSGLAPKDLGADVVNV